MQQPSMPTLQSLLGTGISVQDFMNKHWERKPLIIRREDRASGSTAALFNQARMLELVGERVLRHGEHLRVCRFADGERHEIVSAGGPTAIAERSEVASAFDERGCTVQFFQPQRFSDPLWRLQAGLEKELGQLVGASAYLTPPGSQGLAPHHDDVEVFVLQTEGEKRWRLYKPVNGFVLPEGHSRDLAESEIGAPTHDFVLRAGDLLYFPRGIVHQAEATSTQRSTHVTLSTYHRASWGRFLQTAVPALLREAFTGDAAFRRGLPVGFLSHMGEGRERSRDNGVIAGRKGFVRQCQTLLRALASEAARPWLESALDAAADEVALDFVQSRLPPAPEKTEEASTSCARAADFATADSCVLVRVRCPHHCRLMVHDHEKGAANTGNGVDIPDADAGAERSFAMLLYSHENSREHHMGKAPTDEQSGIEEAAAEDEVEMASLVDIGGMQESREDCEGPGEEDEEDEEEGDEQVADENGEDEAEDDQDEAEDIVEMVSLADLQPMATFSAPVLGDISDDDEDDEDDEDGDLSEDATGSIEFTLQESDVVRTLLSESKAGRFNDQERLSTLVEGDEDGATVRAVLMRLAAHGLLETQCTMPSASILGAKRAVEGDCVEEKRLRRKKARIGTVE
jgi:lysine-specific demethylase/histidyl-hydroxylase NO66